MSNHIKTRKKNSFFKDGGWVLMISCFLSLILITWAFAPAFLKMYNRPPGDGENVSNYGFDLTNLTVPYNNLQTAMLYRDMPPVYKNPEFMNVDELNNINNANKRKPLITSDDMVIGIDFMSVQKAYPIRWLNVHEIINDEILNTPIAVTWHWPSGSVNVFDRNINNKTIELGNTGLVANGNLLMFDRSNKKAKENFAFVGLISQWKEEFISGPESGQKIKTVPFKFVPWEIWKEKHPKTLILKPVKTLQKRYKKMNPKPYFLSDEVMFDIQEKLPEDGINKKDFIVRIDNGKIQKLFSLENMSKNNQKYLYTISNIFKNNDFIFSKNPTYIYSENNSIKITPILRFSLFGFNKKSNIEKLNY